MAFEVSDGVGVTREAVDESDQMPRRIQVTENSQRRPAVEPEDLDRMFLERANAGDVDGVVALYEPNAVPGFPPGR